MKTKNNPKHLLTIQSSGGVGKTMLMQKLLNSIKSENIIDTYGSLLDKPEISLDLPDPLRVFICHSSNDKPAVRKFVNRLSSFQIDLWFDEQRLLPGQDWNMEITRAVYLSDIVLICLSRHSVKKAGYVQKEIKYALDIADEKPEGTIFIIPVKLEECEIPERLRRWHWVNIIEEDGFDKLVQALERRAFTLGKALSLR